MKKKKQKKHKDFTVVNKGKEETKRQKHPLIYSNRWQKIQKGRTIRITQHRDQSKRVRWQNSNNWTIVFLSSSKDRLFHSVQIVHIKQPRTKSQISKLCFPSQWYQQNNKSTIEPGMTHSIPKNRIIYIHKEWAIGQKSNRWSTDSALLQHK